MGKAELIDFVAKNADLSKADAAKAVNEVLEGIKSGLKNEGKVSLVGFGTFESKKREAREGRNPLTGATIKIAAKNVPSFKAGSKLKEALN